MPIENNTKEIEETGRKKPVGWKTMPYILGNETFERLASYGLTGNLWVYLLHVYHMDQVFASNIINNWTAVTTFLPLVGGFVSDAFAGKFWTIVFGSFAGLLGMVIMTLTAWIPQLHPSQSNPHTTGFQLVILLTGLCLLSIGTGGIRPCSIPFGVDQFDLTTQKGRKQSSTYYNWYYTSFTVVLIIAQTLIIYIQNDVSWVLGFGIPTALMFFSIIVFFIGSKMFVCLKPEGSLFSSFLQVFVAAYKKRRVNGGGGGGGDRDFYDPPVKQTLLTKLPLTKDFRCLNKAAIVMDNELKTDGSPMNKWKLCSIQQIEDVKCLIRIFPIWVFCIIPFLTMVQTGTFSVSLAMKMDRHLSPSFQVPPAALSVISLITMGLWLPFYDRILVPALQKYTKHPTGITLLQRIGIGNTFSILSLLVAGFVERERRALALTRINDGVAPMSVMWLTPQLFLAGMFDAFNLIGQIEFYNSEFPEHMRSIGTAMMFLNQSGANLVNNLLVNIVHRVTTKDGGTNWLDDDVNVGRIDSFYFLSAGLGVVNFVIFLYFAMRYRYKNNLH